LSVILNKPMPPSVDSDCAKQLMTLIAKGTLAAGILRTDNCRATCKELEERGVEVTQQPDERFYGIDAAIRDPSGNEWRIVQPIEFDRDAMVQAQANHR